MNSDNTNYTLPLLTLIKSNDPNRLIKWYNIININKSALPFKSYEEYFTLKEIKIKQPKSHCNLIKSNKKWTNEEEIILDIIFNEKSYNDRIYFYNIHIKTWRFIFLRVSHELTKQDILNAPFIYTILRMNAIELISIPIEKISSLMKQIDFNNDFHKHCGFLFNTGRCGSTLAAKVISLYPNTIVLQEPDVSHTFVSLYPSGQDNDPWPENNNDKIELKNSLNNIFIISHWLQYICISGEKWQSTFVIFKFTSQVTGLIDLYYELFPFSKYYFMYRNGIKTTSSFYKLVLNTPELLTTLPPILKARYNRNESTIIKKTQLDINNIEDEYYIIACCIWYDNMLHIIRFLEKYGNSSFISFRYEDFLTKPYIILNSIGKTISDALQTKYIEYTNDNKDLINVMTNDSQKGSFVSREVLSNIQVNSTKIKEILNIIHSKYPKENITKSIILSNTINIE